MATPLLHIDNLSIAFRGAPEPVVSDISLNIFPNETVALIGESGSGKSLTALSVLKLLQSGDVIYPSGQILFEEQDILSMQEHALRSIRGARISMIFQEPMTALNPLHTIEKQIAESLMIHSGLSAKQAAPRVKELLHLVQLEGLLDRLDAYPHMLSGGQRQRVMIAMALACEPKLLIADEPTTALDVTVQKQILELMQSLQERTGMAMLFITHDLAIVRKMASRMYVMQKGKIVEEGTTEAIFKAPSHPYTLSLLHAHPTPEPVPVPEKAGRIISVDNVSVSYDKQTAWWQSPKKEYILKKISMILRKGHTLGVVGESGSGKSTLALAIVRLIASEGSIFFEDKPMGTLEPKYLREIRRYIQIVFQDPFASLNPRMSVGDLIAEGLKAHNIGATLLEREAMIENVLQEVGLDPAFKQRYPHALSGGQRQRVAIARALILKPRCIILDEPTSALDVSVQAQVIDLLKELQHKYGLSYIFISHDLRLVRAISHEVVVMHQGRIVERGVTAEVFAHPTSDYTKTLLDASLWHMHAKEQVA